MTGSTRLVLFACLTFMLAGCGGDADTPKASASATETVTVTVTESAVPSESVSPTASGATGRPSPDADDYQAVAIYTIQTESELYGDAPDKLVRDLLETVCFGLLMTDGENVDDQGVEMAEVALESVGVPKSEYPLFMRGSTAFCPQTFDEIIARYGEN